MQNECTTRILKLNNKKKQIIAHIQTALSFEPQDICLAISHPNKNGDEGFSRLKYFLSELFVCPQMSCNMSKNADVSHFCFVLSRSCRSLISAYLSIPDNTQTQRNTLSLRAVTRWTVGQVVDPEIRLSGPMCCC